MAASAIAAATSLLASIKNAGIAAEVVSSCESALKRAGAESNVNSALAFVGRIYEMVGATMLNQGRCEDAVPILDNAIKIFKKVQDPRASKCAAYSAKAIAMICRKAAPTGSASTSLVQKLEQICSILAEDNADASYQIDLANSYALMGLNLAGVVAEARSCLHKAAALYLAAPASSSRQTATMIESVAHAFAVSGDLHMQIRLLQSCRRFLTPTDDSHATVCAYMASSMMDLGQYAQAVQLLSDALKFCNEIDPSGTSTVSQRAVLQKLLVRCTFVPAYRKMDALVQPLQYWDRVLQSAKEDSLQWFRSRADVEMLACVKHWHDGSLADAIVRAQRALKLLQSVLHATAGSPSSGQITLTSLVRDSNLRLRADSRKWTLPCDLFEVLVLLSTLYTLQGSPVFAGKYAQQALDVANQLAWSRYQVEQRLWFGQLERRKWNVQSAQQIISDAEALLQSTLCSTNEPVEARGGASIDMPPADDAFNWAQFTHHSTALNQAALACHQQMFSKADDLLTFLAAQLTMDQPLGALSTNVDDDRKPVSAQAKTVRGKPKAAAGTTRGRKAKATSDPAEIAPDNENDGEPLSGSKGDGKFASNARMIALRTQSAQESLRLDFAENGWNTAHAARVARLVNSFSVQNLAQADRVAMMQLCAATLVRDHPVEVAAQWSATPAAPADRPTSLTSVIAYLEKAVALAYATGDAVQVSSVLDDLALVSGRSDPWRTTLCFGAAKGVTFRREMVLSLAQQATENSPVTSSIDEAMSKMSLSEVDDEKMSKTEQLHQLLSASNFAQNEQHFKTSFAKLWPSSWSGVTVGVTSDGKYLSISRLESHLSAPVVLLLPWAGEGSAASTGAVKAERSAAVTESSPHSASTAAGRDDGQRETGRRARQQSVDGLVCSDAAFVEEPASDGVKEVSGKVAPPLDPVRVVIAVPDEKRSVPGGSHLLQRYNEIIAASDANIAAGEAKGRCSSKDKQEWTNQRSNLNATLQTLLMDVEAWLGPWRSMFSAGPVLSAQMTLIPALLAQWRSMCLAKIQNKKAAARGMAALATAVQAALDTLPSDLLCVLLASSRGLATDEVTTAPWQAALAYILDWTASPWSAGDLTLDQSAILCDMASVIPSCAAASDKRTSPSETVETRIDQPSKRKPAARRGAGSKEVESLVERKEAAAPSDAIDVPADKARLILVLSRELQHFPWESTPMLSNASVYRMPCLLAVMAQLQVRSPSQIVRPTGGHYVVDPDNEFVATTQATLKGELAMPTYASWSGSMGASVPLPQFCDALKEPGLYLYCGHGAGERVVKADVIRKQTIRSAALLMGCSSGLLKPNGEFDPTGMALAFLEAGSPAVVANLCAVTDKEIDRFTVALLRGLCEPTASGSPVDISLAACAARRKCHLRYLTGAAAVCFGLPTEVSN